MAKDYYQILGVERGATSDDIKKAFHKLAHRYHPDKKGGDEGKFKEVNEAYQVLSDVRKRQAYDNYGQAGGAGPDWNQQAAGGWDFGGFDTGGQTFQFDLGDLFGEFFGGGPVRAGRRRTRRGRDISVDIQIPFGEAIFGNERTLLITKIGQCDHCAGSGAEPGSSKQQCVTCNGRGQIRETRRSLLGSFSAVRECEICAGAGEVPEHRCAICGGHGVMRKNEEIKVTIPPGITDGEMIRLAGRGEAAPKGVAGDLYVKVHVERHPVFRRESDNLAMDLNIKLSDAILGVEQELKTLDGQVKVKVPEGISSGEILRVKGRGVPTGPGRRGDLYIHIKVKTPDKLSKKARKIIEDLRAEGL
ncbi:MAG: J domain-containing protein [Candidatus Vogelbacteria bacterium]|nr:J domain-containing protein [Candidatus Vogelbacteria bacterium]